MQKKVNGKAAPRQQFLFPDKLYLLPSRRTFPALRLPSESSSLTLLFLYSATTTLYFFLPLFLSSVSADYALQLPTYQPTNYRPAGGVKLSNPAERRRMMKFFLWGSSYRCIKMYGHVLPPSC